MTRFFLNTALSLLAASTLAAQATPAKPTQVKPKTIAAATAAPMQAPATKPAKTAAAPRRTDGTMVTTDQVKAAQQALLDKGTYKGKVTGKLNKDFRKAVKEFQTQNQLKATGRLNQETLAKLNIH
ncbi:MAG: peptidoglycan-binding domain-containing protein [Gemmatimonadota bacterium]